MFLLVLSLGIPHAAFAALVLGWRQILLMVVFADAHCAALAASLFPTCSVYLIIIIMLKTASIYGCCFNYLYRHGESNPA